MVWRLAKSLDKLRDQVNAQYPKRDKSSDGTIGDEAHASRTSDHNPWVKDGKTGVVTGMDITNDPKNGPVSNDLALALVASKDPRIKYVISNAQICSGDAGPSPWKWRKYTGANEHRHHVHISVKSQKGSYDSVKFWNIPTQLKTVPEPQPEAPAKVQPPIGQQNGSIYAIQQRLDKLGYHEVGMIDGKWGSKTAAAIAAFKSDRHVDGEPVIDLVLRTALDTAEKENWQRPIAKEREEATEATVAKNAPEIVPVQRGRFAAFWATLVSGLLAIVNAVADYFHDALSWVVGLKQYAADAPAYVWFGLAFGVALIIWFAAKNGAQGIVDAFRKGERS